MPIALFLALAAVYLIGVAGVFAVGSLVGPQPSEPQSLDARLAAIRSATDRRRNAPPGDLLAYRRPHSRRTDGARSQSLDRVVRVIESLSRAFTPVPDRRMRSDVATSGSRRSARSD